MSADTPEHRNATPVETDYTAASRCPPPVCPECSRPMRSGGSVLSGRQDDGRRACRSLWSCAGRHLWWKWADRPEEPLEACPLPELFR